MYHLDGRRRRQSLVYFGNSQPWLIRECRVVLVSYRPLARGVGGVVSSLRPAPGRGGGGVAPSRITTPIAPGFTKKTQPWVSSNLKDSAAQKEL